MKVIVPTVTSSPSRTPARSKARSTPSRRSRRMASVWAPPSFRSEKATARSAARPSTSQPPAAAAPRRPRERVGAPPPRSTPPLPPPHGPGGRARPAAGSGRRCPSPVPAEITRSHTPSSSSAMSALAADDETWTFQQFGWYEPSSESSTRSWSAGGSAMTAVPRGPAAGPARGPARCGAGTGSPTLAPGRPLDQPGDVGHHELGAVPRSPDAHHPECGSSVVKG